MAGAPPPRWPRPGRREIIRAGQVLLLPLPDTTRGRRGGVRGGYPGQVLVPPGDGLSEIAERELGDPDGYEGIGSTNGGQVMLTEPGVPAGQRNTGLDQARVEAEQVQGYENRWDLLASSATACPVLPPRGFRVLALEDRVGLPPRHPWNDTLPNW